MSEEYLFGFLNLLTVLFGCTGNFLIIFSLYHQKNLLKKNNHYYLVLHLAICDLVCLLFSVEDIYVSFGGNAFPFSTVFCKSWTTILTTFFIMEVLVMVLISAVRFRAVVYPLRAPLRRWQINLAIALAWVFAILCVTPLFPLFKFSQAGCYIDWPGKSLRLGYTLFLSAVQYFIPVLLLALIYQQIYVKIRQQRRRRQLLIASTDSRTKVQKRTTFKTLKRDKNGRIVLISLTIVLCYVVCSLPMQCISILMATGSSIAPKYYSASYVLFLAGVCSLNPFIYKVLDKKIFLFLQQLMRKTFTKNARNIKNATRNTRKGRNTRNVRNSDDILTQSLPNAPFRSEFLQTTYM